MRKSLVLLVLLAACGQDAETVFEPQSASLVNLPSSTARMWIDETEYEYGCPTFPCPVSPLVKQQVDAGNWFILPSGQGPTKGPVIYLYALRTPIQLRRPAEGPIDPPIIQPIKPQLSGPAAVLAKRLAISGQLTCSPVKLNLYAPDGGTWDFVSGDIKSTHVKYDQNSNSWVNTSPTVTETWTLVMQQWNQILAGTWTFFVKKADQEFRAVVTVTLARGNVQHTLTHTVLCHMAPPPPPPAPELSGPQTIFGRRPQPVLQLVCPDVDLDLYAPDGGSWSFQSGSRSLAIYNWDSVKKLFVASGQVINSSLSSGDWAGLLAGTYDVDPVIFTGPYLATFTVTVNRGVWVHTVSHTVACGGDDFIAQFGGSSAAN
jgi:hypothetical protein